MRRSWFPMLHLSHESLTVQRSQLPHVFTDCGRLFAFALAMKITKVLKLRYLVATRKKGQHVCTRFFVRWWIHPEHALEAIWRERRDRNQQVWMVSLLLCHFFENIDGGDKSAEHTLRKACDCLVSVGVHVHLVQRAVIKHRGMLCVELQRWFNQRGNRDFSPVPPLFRYQPEQ